MVSHHGGLLKTPKMGGKGRKNKVVLSKGGVLKRAVGSKSDTDVRKSGLEDAEKKQREGVKLGANGLAPIGFDVEGVEKSQLTPSDSSMDTYE
ncbi:hypothetical protein SLA2020_529120 [Shorea laevis]